MMRKMLLVFFFVPVFAWGENGEEYALSFNGNSAFVVVEDRTIDLSSDFTVECWIRFNGLTGDQVVVAKSEDPRINEVATWEFGLWKHGGDGAKDNCLWFVVGSSDDVSSQQVQSTTLFTSGIWYHVAAVVSGTTMELYIDGKLESSAKITKTRRADLDGNMVFGASPAHAADIVKDPSCFDGEMDDVCVWGHARTEARIQGTVRSVLTGNEPGLQAYYPMSNGDGETVDDDQKDGKNKGTIHNAVWVKAASLPVSLVSFGGVHAGGATTLRWSTASETNNYGFEVERRDAATVAWMRIGFVAGHGTTIAPQSYEFTDGQVSAGQYAYRLKQIDLDGTAQYSDPIVVDLVMGLTGSAPEETVPRTTTLAQNYPNPFNPSTMIEFTVSKAGRAKLVVYDMLGREVAVLADGEFTPGVRHRVQFDGSRLSSGMYLYRLTADGKAMIRSLTLTK